MFSMWLPACLPACLTDLSLNAAAWSSLKQLGASCCLSLAPISSYLLSYMHASNSVTTWASALSPSCKIEEYWRLECAKFLDQGWSCVNFIVVVTWKSSFWFPICCVTLRKSVLPCYIVLHLWIRLTGFMLMSRIALLVMAGWLAGWLALWGSAERSQNFDRDSLPPRPLWVQCSQVLLTTHYKIPPCWSKRKIKSREICIINI